MASAAGTARGLRRHGGRISWLLCVDGTEAPSPHDEVAEHQVASDGTDVSVEVLEGAGWGVSVARNVALAKMPGDWVFPLGADDVLLPRGMVDVADELREGVAWVGSSRQELDGRANEHRVRRRRALAAGAVNTEYVHPYEVHPNNVAYRLDALTDAGGWPATPGGEDLVLFLRVAQRHAGVLIPAESVGYRRWGNQTTAGGGERSVALAAPGISCTRTSI